jgi:hypothetical protein
MNSRFFILTFFAVLTIGALQAQNQSGQDSTGLPGDNFSLQGALHLFQKSASPEDFEKQLNTESNHVNNLDLNEDGDIDYIRVIDKTGKDVHALILQVPVSESENQDIAVIEIEKTGDATAILQIIGDEDIYGEEVIVEPLDETSSTTGNKGGSFGDLLPPDWWGSKSGDPLPPDWWSSLNNHYGLAVVVNVWLWPSVQFVYAPVYRPWVSPWRWHYYPAWWRPWRPVTWHVWHPFYSKYRHSYVITPTHRVVRAHRIYTPVRTTSVTVHTRHATAIGHYHVNRTRTTVTGPRGHTTTVKKTTVRGPRGKVRGTRTTVRRH